MFRQLCMYSQLYVWSDVCMASCMHGPLSVLVGGSGHAATPRQNPEVSVIQRGHTLEGQSSPSFGLWAILCCVIRRLQRQTASVRSSCCTAGDNALRCLKRRPKCCSGCDVFAENWALHFQKERKLFLYWDILDKMVIRLFVCFFILLGFTDDHFHFPQPTCSQL